MDPTLQTGFGYQPYIQNFNVFGADAPPVPGFAPAAPFEITPGQGNVPQGVLPQDPDSQRFYASPFSNQKPGKYHDQINKLLEAEIRRRSQPQRGNFGLGLLAYASPGGARMAAMIQANRARQEGRNMSLVEAMTNYDKYNAPETPKIVTGPDGRIYWQNSSGLYDSGITPRPPGGAAEVQYYRTHPEDWEFQKKILEIENPKMPPQFGTPPSGYGYAQDENGDWYLKQLPVQKSAEEAAKEAEKDVQKAYKAAEGADWMMNNISDIYDKLDSGWLPDVGTGSGTLAQWASGSDAARIRTYVSNMTAPQVLKALTDLKEASANGSTGFGALQEKELEQLINELGSISEKRLELMHKDDFRKIVGNIERHWKNTLNAAYEHLSDEDLAKYGLPAREEGSFDPGTGGVVPTDGEEWLRRHPNAR